MGINQYKINNSKRSRVFFFLLLFALWANAQESAQLLVTISPDSVRLGTPLEVDVQLLLPTNSVVNSLTFPLDSLENIGGRMNPEDSTKVPYEIVDFGKWTPINKNLFLPAQMNWQPQTAPGGKQVFQNSLRLIIWEPGLFKLPPTMAEVQLPQGTYDLYSAEEIIMIGLPDQNQVTSIDSSGIAPIKSILREDPVSWLGIILASVVGLILLLLLLFYILSKAKSKKLEPVVIPPTADETALAALQIIEENADWEKGELKKYYDELTHVLRKYLEDRYEIKALESTTHEILQDLKKIELEESWTNSLVRLLPMTDMVKFAKMQPHDEEHTKWLEWSKSLVMATKKEIMESEDSTNEMD